MFTSTTDFAQMNAISIAESLVAPQVVYLDFDGAATSYVNADLGVAIDNVTVEDSGISESDIAVIVDALNGMFDDVAFTSSLPADGEFSTIYVGVTSAFDKYGSFLGLAETIDSGNQIRDDNAFVLLDSSTSTELVVSVIAHETEHIVHGMDHGGDGLERFADINVVGGGLPSVSAVISNDRMNVYSQGMAISTTVNRGGGMNVYSNGVAYYTTVNAGGMMEVYSGGIAIGTTVNNGGLMHVYIQGMANSTTVNSNGRLDVYSGGVAIGTTVTNGLLHVSNGGVASTTVVEDSIGRIYVHIGGTTYNTSVLHGGAIIFNGGTAISNTVSQGGSIFLSSGNANVTTLNGGSMALYSGGSATSTTLNGGWINFFWGGTATSTTINGGEMFLNGAIVTSTTVDSGGSMTIFNGMATSTTVNGGFMDVLNGGTANCTTMSGGEMDVSSGGVAVGTTINGGEIRVLLGGTATSTTVDVGNMGVWFGATADSTTLNGGEMHVFSGGTANSTTLNGTYMLVSSGVFATSTIVSSGAMYISQGGIANNTTLNGGEMAVSSGGTANSTTLNDGSMCVFSGGIANSTTVSSGYMVVSIGGTAISTVVDDYGHIIVYSGGTATSTTLHNYGVMYVYSGTANNTTMDHGHIIVLSGGAMNITNLDGGVMSIHNDAAATSTTINGGWVNVPSGTVTCTTLNNGSMFVMEGGTATSTTVNSGGKLIISSGGTHGGSLQIADGGIVSAYSGATIDFTVAQQEDRAVALINRYDYITGETPTFTITVSSTEEHGRYALAGYASAFNSTVTVKTTSGTELGTLTVGGSLVSDNTIYSLTIDEQTLFLDVLNALLTNVKCQTDGNNAVVDWSGDGTMELSRSYDARLSNGDGTVVVDGLAASGLELLNLPAGEIGVSVKPGLSDVWTELDALEISDVSDDTSVALSGVENGMAEVMFARGGSVWGSGYRAWHAGGDWGSAGQTVELEGKNRLDDIFIGSDDATLLLLTDDTNGDALFVDDIYSAFPDGIDVQARVAKIDEIRAGAGDDVVDLTSPRYKYVGGGLTIRGGDGDDVIWAVSGSNRLFGDAGDDRIVGADGDDVVVGGAGNDAMHGGGGDDIFCFCGGWGNDTVAQLATGTVTLWFADGDESKWDAEKLTYTDGENSVTVTGVADVTLLFGNADERYDGLLAAAAFDAFTSERIFEEQNLLVGKVNLR